MTHYDVIILFLTILFACGLAIFLWLVLSSASWGKADQLAHEAVEELPLWNNPFYWDEMLPTKNCRECQQGKDEQVL